jgi:hypothetical protein
MHEIWASAVVQRHRLETPPAVVADNRLVDAQQLTPDPERLCPWTCT